VKECGVLPPLPSPLGFNLLCGLSFVFLFYLYSQL
jgi:hypothetical protein